jgi:D-glycero-D-manno-heptose 1,7-bisphosphate phosphatase
MNRKALFLDRDGVINEEKNYVYRIADFEFMDGIFELLAHAQSLNYILIVITNQAGIARGYYTEKDFNKLNDWMVEKFSAKGIIINQVYYCPYHPTHGLGEYKKDSEFRKPGPGMILQAEKELHLNLAQSVLIGDKESDIEAGLKAGVGQTVLLKSDRYPAENTKANRTIEKLTEIIPLLNS